MGLSKKIAFCSVTAALGAAVMLCSYFPYTTYAIPALAGISVLIVAVEISPKWACLSFAVSGLIALIAAEPEAKMLYILFFGYYPILKGRLERVRPRAVEYLLKFLAFNTAAVLAGLVSAYIFLIPIEEIPAAGEYSAIMLLAAGNVVFFVYDFALTRLIAFYIKTLHPRIKNTLR